MGQIQNGHLYTRYRSSFMKQSRWLQKLTDYGTVHPTAKSALQVLLTFLKVEKNKHENFNSLHLPSSFFLLSSSCIPQKLYDVCKYYTYHMTALLPDIFLFWFGAMYELQLVSFGHKTIPQYTRRFHSATLWFLFMNFSVIQIVRPDPDYWMHALLIATSLLATNCV